MAPLMLVATLASAAISAYGAVKAGKDQQAALDFEAKQHERQAADELAAGQRLALDKRREGDLAMSAVRATAADSGAGVLTPNIMEIFGSLGEQADLNARAEIYGGQNRQAGKLDAATANKVKGKSIYQGSILSGIGEGLKGVGKAYGGGGGSSYG